MKESQETKNEITDELPKDVSKPKGIQLDATTTQEVIDELAKTNPELSSRLINIRG